MKAILEFNLPEENEEFETAQKGIDYKIIIDDISEYLRKKFKYSTDGYKQTEVEFFEKIADEIFEIINS